MNEQTISKSVQWYIDNNILNTSTVLINNKKKHGQGRRPNMDYAPSRAKGLCTTVRTAVYC